MKVTSKKNIHFPKFSWGINKGDTRELPADKDAQEAILAHKAISQAGSSTTPQKPQVDGEEKGNVTNRNK